MPSRSVDVTARIGVIAATVLLLTACHSGSSPSSAPGPTSAVATGSPTGTTGTGTDGGTTGPGTTGSGTTGPGTTTTAPPAGGGGGAPPSAVPPSTVPATTPTDTLTPAPAAGGPDAGAIGDLFIAGQSPHCDFVPDGSIGGGDEVAVSVHITWTSVTLPAQLVPVTISTSSGDRNSINVSVDLTPSDLTSISFVPRTTDFGTNLHITITIDPANVIPETDPTNNVTHVTFPLPAPRPVTAATDLPCSMS